MPIKLLASTDVSDMFLHVTSHNFIQFYLHFANGRILIFLRLNIILYTYNTFCLFNNGHLKLVLHRNRTVINEQIQVSLQHTNFTSLDVCPVVRLLDPVSELSLLVCF